MSETIKVVETAEPVKPSKLDKAKTAIATGALFVLPIAATGGLTYLSYKLTRMQLDTAKLNLEAAKLTQS